MAVMPIDPSTRNKVRSRPVRQVDMRMSNPSRQKAITGSEQPDFQSEYNTWMGQKNVVDAAAKAKEEKDAYYGQYRDRRRANAERAAAGQFHGGLGLVSNAARDIANKNRARNLIRDVYGLKGDIGNAYELADASWGGITLPGGGSVTGGDGGGGGGGGGGGSGGGGSGGGGGAPMVVPGLGQFGDLKTLQDALWRYRSGLNANQLGRDRLYEDYAMGSDKYDRGADRLRRGIPGAFNQRGMLNSGQFNRGMGEFEAQFIRDKLTQKHALNRALQDIGFQDRSYMNQFTDSIRENAMEDAFASAAEAANVEVPGLGGGFTSSGTNRLNSAAAEAMMRVIENQFQGRS